MHRMESCLVPVFLLYVCRDTSLISPKSQVHNSVLDPVHTHISQYTA
jgi:hypothetical protein